MRPSPCTRRHPTHCRPGGSNVAHDVLRDVVNVNTAQGGDGTTKAAEIVSGYLRQAGFAEADLSLVGPDPKNLNLIVRLHGTAKNARPMLLIAHLDTVTANRADWTTDPFVFTEKDGWWYGRGIVDDKSGVGTIVTNLVRWKQEGLLAIPRHRDDHHLGGRDRRGDRHGLDRGQPPRSDRRGILSEHRCRRW